MTTYTDVFGGQTLPPSDYEFLAITLSADTEFSWPDNTVGPDILANINEVTAGVGFSLTLPRADQTGTGRDLLFRNIGANAFDIKDNGGNVVATVATGETKYLYITDNSTPAGIWTVFTFGTGTSGADASVLAGNGLTVLSSELALEHTLSSTASTLNIALSDRATGYVLTGGVVSIVLPSVVVATNGFFFFLNNAGTGTATISTDGSEMIDNALTKSLNPGESAMVICSGSAWYTIGYGRSTEFQFTQLVKDVSAGGTFNLTSVEASNKLLKFIGTPISDVVINVPAVVAIYYVQNAYSGPKTLEIKTAAGTGPTLNSSDRVIVYSDGVDVVLAQTVAVAFSLSVIDGTAINPAIFFTSDSDTGFFKAASGELGITGNGVETARFSSTGLIIPGNLTTSLGALGSAAYTSASLYATYTALAASSGSSLLGFLQSGTGAVARTMQSKERDVISVFDFAPVGDGVADDRNALNVANASTTTDIYFPLATYRVASNLTLSRNCLFAKGAKLLATNGAIITISGEVLAGHRSFIFDTDGTGTYALTVIREASAHWFGALGNNSADDGIPTQRTLDALALGNALLYEGTYQFQTSVVVTGSGKGVKGLGNSSTVIVKKTLSTSALKFVASSITTTKCFDIIVQDLRFQTAAGDVHTGGAFVELYACDRATIKNLTLISPFFGLKLTSVQNTQVFNIDALISNTESFTGSAYVILNEDATALKRENANVFLNNVRGRGPTITGAGNTMDYGCLIQSADGIWADGCYFGNVNLADVRIDPQNADTQVTGVNFDNYWLDPVGSAGTNLQISGATSGFFGLIAFNNGKIAGGSVGLRNIILTPTAGTTLYDISFVDAELFTSVSTGILVVDNGTVSVFGLTFDSLRVRQASTSGTSVGIALNAVKNFSVSDCKSGYQVLSQSAASALYGLQITSTCSDGVVEGNVLLGNATNGILITGAVSPTIKFSNNRLPDAQQYESVATAATVTLPPYTDSILLTGNVGVTSITASWSGRVVRIVFSGTPTVTDGGNLKLAGNLVATADDAITLLCDGTNWIEQSRSVN